MFRSPPFALCFLAFVLACPAFAYDEAVDAVMYLDPDPPRPGRVKFFPKELIPLWLEALARPEADMKRLAATFFAEAQRRGMSGLEVTVPPLLAMLNTPGQHPTVRLAAAQALIALDARETAEPLFQAARDGGIDLRNVVEPALARWDYAPAREVWLERLRQPAEPRQGLMLALQGLGTVREPRAAATLRDLALAPTTNPMLRLEAARSLGRVRTRGSEQDATRLLTEADPVARVAAAALLRLHRGDQAIDLLKRMTRDSEPAVILAALEALYEADPCLVAVLARPLGTNPDAKVRQRAVEAMRKCPAPTYVPLLAELTNDPHPGVRVEARKALRELARRPEYDGPIRREATRVLAAKDWRGLEQMIILLTQLDQKAAAPRFLELLHFERPEVLVTAAWGLRKLALPETLPALQRMIEHRLDPRFRPRTAAQYAAIDLQVAQLAQALGQGRYRPADALLRTFVPMGSGTGNESRAAAIWALGFIHENAPPADLTQQLIERMAQLEDLFNPEDPRVGWTSAASLGRMKAQEAEDILRHYYKGAILEMDKRSNNCWWALNRITGEPLNPGEPLQLRQRGWFLEPAQEAP